MGYLRRDLLWIALSTLALTLLLWPFEQSLARFLYQPENTFAWQVRNWSIYPGALLSVAGILFLLLPPLRTRWPLLRRSAVVWLATLILGSGLVGSFAAPEVFNRPRPRDTLTLGGTQHYTPPLMVSAAEKGKSFTSGHAAIGFIFCAPFFALRRRRPKFAWGLMVGGLLWGSFLGYQRMVLGAHWATDVLWAGSIILMTAAIAARLFPEERDLPSRYSLPFILFALGCVVFFNKLHEELRFTAPPGSRLVLDVPCDKIHFQRGESVLVHLDLHTYGAPASHLRLEEDGDTLRLVKKFPIFYRNLRCTATVTADAGSKITLAE